MTAVGLSEHPGSSKASWKCAGEHPGGLTQAEGWGLEGVREAVKGIG